MDALELKMPPLALTLVLAAVMWGVATATPVLALVLPWRIELAVVLAAVGLAFAAAGVVAFRRAKTTVNPTAPGTASMLVAGGVYGISRNPMYVGFLLLLAGWAVFLGHVLGYVFPPAFVLYMNRFQILPEERALSERFGRSYLDYLQSVRRWL